MKSLIVKATLGFFCLFSGLHQIKADIQDSTYTFQIKRIQLGASSSISYADAISKASKRVPSGYAIQSQTLKRIGGRYHCFLICIKVD